MIFEVEDKIFDNAEDAIEYYAEIVGSDYNNEDILNEEWFYDLCVQYINVYDDEGNPLTLKEVNL